MNVSSSVTVSESITMVIRAVAANVLKQTGLRVGGDIQYRLTLTASGLAAVSGTGNIHIFLDDQYLGAVTTDTSGEYTFDFTADANSTIITFEPDQYVSTVTIDSISVRTLGDSLSANNPTAEFLTGDTDFGDPIHMTIETHHNQLLEQFEVYSGFYGVVNRVRRGAQLKCFVSLDYEDFYELDGTIDKGVSVMKIQKRYRSSLTGPPVAKRVRLAWRDSSDQRPRLLQSGIIFAPASIESSP